MQQDERPGTGGPAAGGQLAREGHKEGKIIRNKEIQRDAGTAQGHGIGSGIGKGPGKQGEIPEKAFIRTETEITGEKLRIPQEGGQEHVMDAQGELAGSDSLFPAAEEKGDIRRAGAEIQHHKASAGILRGTEAEISPEGRRIGSKGDGRNGRIADRERITAFPENRVGKREKEIHEGFAAVLRHFIRKGEPPGEGGSTFKTGLERSHEKHLMKTEEAGAAFFLLPAEGGINRVGGR